MTYGYDGSLVTAVTTTGTQSVRDGSTTLWSGGLRGSVVYGYNNQHDVSSISVQGAAGAPNGFAATIGRDNDDLVTSIAPTGGGSVPTLTLTRSPLDGHVVSSTQGAVTSEYAMDISTAAPGYGELQGISNKVNGSEIYGVTYIRDRLGRIERLDETIEGQHRTRKYVYDQVGRLHQVLDENDALIHQYDYDQNGARVGEMSGAGTIALGTNLGCGPMLDTPVDAQDRLCRYGDFNYTYDANGRLSSKTQISTGAQTGYMYDGNGGLRAVLLPNGTRIDYVLDALGRRIGKVVGGALVRGWLYGGSSLRPMAQLDATGQIEATFVYATRANVPDTIVMRSGAVYRVLADHLGSVRLVMDAANGGVLQRLDYDEFGNVLEDTNPGFQPFGFAGGLYDADTGLVRFGARDYDPVVGRWTAKDPLLFGGGDTDLYAYCGNDPVNCIDPSGLAWYDGIDVGNDSFLGRWADNIERNRSDAQLNRALDGLGDAVLAGSAATSAYPKWMLPPFRQPAGFNPNTSIASSAASAAERAGLISIAERNAIRVAGRAASRVGTPLLIAQGFWDLGVVAWGAYDALRDRTPCK
jgi:RHS repeat-associated protein